jgi:hypothetical protein
MEIGFVSQTCLQAFKVYQADIVCGIALLIVGTLKADSDARMLKSELHLSVIVFFISDCVQQYSHCPTRC